MKNSVIKLISVLMVILLILCGCSKKGSEAEEDNMTEIDFEMMDLSAVADIIYKESNADDITLKSVSKITDETVLSEQFYLNLDNVEEYEVRSADGRYGVADIALFKVKEGTAEDVMNSMELRKDDRINEFSNYDVLDSYDIAQKAEVYKSGELVVMLMLDEDSKQNAMKIIDAFTAAE